MSRHTLKKFHQAMLKALNKLRSNSEVRSVIDAAESLESSESRVLDAQLTISSQSFHSFVSESAPSLHESLTAINAEIQCHTTALNESFSQRSVKAELRLLLANQDSYTRLVEMNRDLERKFRGSEENVQKKKAAFEKARGGDDTVAVMKSQTALGIAKDQLERDQKAYFESNEQLENEGEFYRGRIVEMLTKAMEKMLESRRTALIGVRKCGPEISRIVRGLEFQEESQAELEQQLELLNAELAEMGV
jgi:hypothetical protein